MPSSPSSSLTSVRISLSARARSACASASRFRRLSSFRCTFALSSTYCARGACGRAPAPGAPGAIVDAGAATPGLDVLIVGYQIDASFSKPEQPALGGRQRRRLAARIEHTPREAVELRRDVGVARERQRHARVERRRHGLVVARKRVVNRMPERAFDLLRRNRVRLGGAVEQHAHALAARAELPHAIEQPLRVAHRRHVRIRDEETSCRPHTAPRPCTS